MKKSNLILDRNQICVLPSFSCSHQQKRAKLFLLQEITTCDSNIVSEWHIWCPIFISKCDKIVFFVVTVLNLQFLILFGF